MAETRKSTPPNTLRAEALSPELITLENGHQVVRLALRTETGTIVYAELGYGEAGVYANRVGRFANVARETSERLAPAPEPRERTRHWST